MNLLYIEQTAINLFGKFFSHSSENKIPRSSNMWKDTPIPPFFTSQLCQGRLLFYSTDPLAEYSFSLW